MFSPSFELDLILLLVLEIWKLRYRDLGCVRGQPLGRNWAEFCFCSLCFKTKVKKHFANC